MSAASVGLSVGASGSWVTTYGTHPHTGPPPTSRVRPPLFLSLPLLLSRAGLFCRQFMPPEIVQISSEGLRGHPACSPHRFFFGSRLVNVGKQLPVSPQSHFLVKIESSFIDSQVHYLILVSSYMEFKLHGQVMCTPITKKTKFNSIGQVIFGHTYNVAKLFLFWTNSLH